MAGIGKYWWIGEVKNEYGGGSYLKVLFTKRSDGTGLVLSTKGYGHDPYRLLNTHNWNATVFNKLRSDHGNKENTEDLS